MNLDLLKLYALAFLGKPYFWGGDDPISGFDCSGFVSELLRAAGVVPYNFRTNAQGLFNHLKSISSAVQPQLGAVAFFGKNVNEITHIGFCLDSTIMVEAGGGGSATIDGEIASQQNAFVRLRPIRFRKDFLFAVMPKY